MNPDERTFVFELPREAAPLLLVLAALPGRVPVSILAQLTGEANGALTGALKSRYGRLIDSGHLAVSGEQLVLSAPLRQALTVVSRSPLIIELQQAVAGARHDASIHLSGDFFVVEQGSETAALSEATPVDSLAPYLRAWLALPEAPVGALPEPGAVVAEGTLREAYLLGDDRAECERAFMEDGVSPAVAGALAETFADTPRRGRLTLYEKQIGPEPGAVSANRLTEIAWLVGANRCWAISPLADDAHLLTLAPSSPEEIYAATDQLVAQAQTLGGRIVHA